MNNKNRGVLHPQSNKCNHVKSSPTPSATQCVAAHERERGLARYYVMPFGCDQKTQEDRKGWEGRRGEGGEGGGGGAEEEEKGADASPQAEQVTVGRFNEWRESPETKLQEVFICPKRGKNSLKVGLPLWTCCYLRKKKDKKKKKEVEHFSK